MSRRYIIPDPFRFAAERRVQSGKLSPDALERSQDLLLPKDGEMLDWQLSGWREEDGQAFFSLTLSGTLTLVCQRCLSGMPWVFDATTIMRLVKPGTPVSDEELEVDTFDTIEAFADLDVLALVEDEILISMPTVPRHDDCQAPVATDAGQEDSPFAVLAKLRGKRNN